MPDGLSDIESVTMRVVDHHVEEGFLFTALDISNLVKQSLPGVRHREVAPIVRSLYESGRMGPEYTRSSIDVVAGRKKVTAFLYHLDEDDPDDYAGTQRQQAAIPPVPVSASTTPPVGPPARQATLEIGRDGRARIPLGLLQAAGVRSGEVAVGLDGGGPQLRLIDHDPARPERPLGVLSVLHPTVLHLPLGFLSAFDLSRPVTAHARAGHVLIDGTRR